MAIPTQSSTEAHAKVSDEASSTRRTLTVPTLVFMIIAASAPLTVLAGGAPTSFAVTGLVGVPMGYLILGIILVLFAVGYGAMSAQVHNAGAFYAYVTAGLGIRQGIGASLLALVSYNAMQVGLWGLFGFASASLVSGVLGITVPWWAAALLGWILVGWLGINKIDLSAKVVAVVVALEFVVVILFNIMSFIAAPEGVNVEAFAPENFLTNGLGAILAFGIAAFMGFESGAIYSEEVKDPRRSVSRATFIAVSIIAVFYAFSAWALTIGIGPSQVVAQSQEFGPDLMFVFLDKQGSTLLSDIANVLFITSLLAALIAFHNAAARYFFSLGRARVLPQWLASTGKKNHAPVAGSLTQSALALVLIIVFAIFGMGSELGELFPVITMFTWLTNAGAFGLVFLLAVTSAAIIGFFRKDHRGYSPFVRLWAPALATIGLGTVFVLVLLNFDVLIGAEGSSVLVIVMPVIILGSGVVGLIWGEVLRRTRPEIFNAMADTDIS